MHELISIRRRLHLVALWWARRLSAWLDQDEARSIADLAMVEAAVRYDPGRDVSFFTFARHRVRGAVLRAANRYRRAWDESLTHVPSYAPPDPENVAISRRQLQRLSPLELRVATLHLQAGLSLAAVARDHERHPSWASRVMASARRRLAEAPPEHDGP